MLSLYLKWGVPSPSSEDAAHLTEYPGSKYCNEGERAVLAAALSSTPRHFLPPARVVGVPRSSWDSAVMWVKGASGTGVRRDGGSWRRDTAFLWFGWLEDK